MNGSSFGERARGQMSFIVFLRFPTKTLSATKSSIVDLSSTMMINEFTNQWPTLLLENHQLGGIFSWRPTLYGSLGAHFPLNFVSFCCVCVWWSIVSIAVSLRKSFEKDPSFNIFAWNRSMPSPMEWYGKTCVAHCAFLSASPPPPLLIPLKWNDPLILMTHSAAALLAAPAACCSIPPSPLFFFFFFQTHPSKSHFVLKF